METTKDGDVVMVTGKGTGRQTIGSTTGNFEGESTCKTMSSRLSWLNNAKVRVEGTFDSKNLETHIKAYMLKQEVAAQAPM
jgi:hypothetical protein